MKLSVGARGKALLWGLIISLILSILSSYKPLLSEEVAATIVSIALKCYTCQIISPLLKAISGAVDAVYAEVSSGLVALLAALYSVWIAYFVMNYVGSFKAQNAQDFWKVFIQKTLMVLCIGLLIATADDLKNAFNIVLFPMIRGFVDLGLVILNSTGSTISCGSSLGAISGNTSALLTSLAVPIECLVNALHTSNSSGIILGAKIISTANLGFWTAIVGTFILFFFIIIDLLFPLQLFDSLFRMGIMMILFPIALMLAAFQVTRPIIGRVFVYFIAVTVHIAIISVVFAVCIMVVQDVMKSINPQFFVMSNTVKLSDNALKNMSSIEMQELAMMAILIYMLYILNLFNEMIAMVAGIGVGSAMAKGVKDKGLKTGVGVANASMRIVSAGANIGRNSIVKGVNKLKEKNV